MDPMRIVIDGWFPCFDRTTELQIVINKAVQKIANFITNTGSKTTQPLSIIKHVQKPFTGDLRKEYHLDQSRAFRGPFCS